MSDELTKAQLRDELAVTDADNKQLRAALKGIDQEALALSSVVNSLEKLPSDSVRVGNYVKADGPNPEAIRRVLDAAARRYGVTPDYHSVLKIIDRAEQTLRLTDKERQELEQLRNWAATNPASGQAVW